MVYIYPPRWRYWLHWLPCKLGLFHAECMHDNGGITCWYCNIPLNEIADPEAENRWVEEARRENERVLREGHEDNERQADANRAAFFRKFPSRR